MANKSVWEKVNENFDFRIREISNKSDRCIELALVDRVTDKVLHAITLPYDVFSSVLKDMGFVNASDLNSYSSSICSS